MRDSLRRHEINTYIHQYDTASQAKEVINTRLDGIGEAIDMKQKSYESAVASYNEAMYELTTIDRNINALREELLTLTVGLEKQAGDMKVLRERLSTLSDGNKRLTGENAALDIESRETLDKIELVKAERADKTVALERAKAEVEKYRADYVVAVEKLTKGENAAKTNQQALLDAMDRLADIKANMSRLLAEREALTSAVGSMDERIAADNETLKRYGEQFTAVKNELVEIAERKTAASDKLQAAYSKNNELLSIANDVTNKLDKLNEKFYTAESRRKILKEMQQAYDGFAFSIKNIMNDAKKNPELNSRIEGVVAQLISMDAKYETAIETALGQSMQNIVTKNEDDAKYIIDYLKRMRYGRITFLPMSAIKPRNIDQRFERSLNTSGCFGVASDLVRYEDKYDGIVRGLLGNTVIVDNIDTAVRLARATGYGFKIVTLEGEVVSPSGAITGGSKKNDIANIFSHGRELGELETIVKKLSDEIASLNARKEKCSDEIDAVQNAIKSEQQTIHECDVEIAAKTEARNKLATDIDELSRTLAELELDRENDAKRIEVINNDINSVSELEELITTKKQTAKMDDETRQHQFDALKTERDELQECMTKARLAVTELESTVKGLDADIERMQSDIKELAEKIAANNAEIEENKKQIATIQDGIKSDEQRDGDADAKRIKVVREKLNHLDEYKSGLQDKVATTDKNRIDLMNELQQLRESKNKEEMLLLKVDTDIEQMEQRVREEYGLEYADCIQYKEEGYNVTHGVQETGRLKRAMNALGNVNIDAIEMSKTVAAEYDELNKQKEDLEKAETDLLKIIKDLSDEMLTRFNSQFSQIRANFIKIFKELFNGGNADLELLDSENPLEAGIEIKAQPPEKKLQSISLLSGGEKALTAIAILFAILKLKPMPFCLLDEIEAALDDANAGRFAKYLRRFSEDTQFIVITHRKPTMELADRLYGVTMEEKGVSKIVSVKFEDAVATAEKA